MPNHLNLPTRLPSRLSPALASKLCSLGIANFRRTKRGCRGGRIRWRPVSRNHLLHVGLVNARSLNCKADAIHHLICDSQLDVLAVTESWLRADTETTDIFRAVPVGFSATHVPRATGGRGGGLALITRSSISTKLSPLFTTSSFEYLYASLISSSSIIRLLIIYRPPPAPTDLFFEEFEKLICHVSSSRRKPRLLIAGDFNIHLEDCRDRAATRFSSLVEALQLKQHVVGPTHLAGHTLDLILSFKSDRLVSRPYVESPFSDHFFIGCWLFVVVVVVVVTTSSLGHYSITEYQEH